LILFLPYRAFIPIGFFACFGRFNEVFGHLKEQNKNTTNHDITIQAPITPKGECQNCGVRLNVRDSRLCGLDTGWILAITCDESHHIVTEVVAYITSPYHKELQVYISLLTLCTSMGGKRTLSIIIKIFKLRLSIIEIASIQSI
jgi:hypothetical protein